VFGRLAHPYTRGLFAARPRLGSGSRDERLVTIPGRVPELTAMPVGCAFADRCGYVTAACREATPPAVQVGAEHHVRCLHVLPPLPQRRRGLG
jgi:peptide/nickel transport system ATP-binding protein